MDEPIATSSRQAIALALFDGAVQAHGLLAEQRPLLHLAAQYYDHVRQNGLERPSRTARDLVLAAPIANLTAEEQCVVASAVAFQGERIKRDQELAFLRLNAGDQQLALRLAAIVALADAFAANAVDVRVEQATHNGTSETVVVVAGERAALAVEAAADRDWRWMETLGPITIRPAAPDEQLPALPPITDAPEINNLPTLAPGEQPFAESARRSLRRHFEKMLAREAEVRSGEDPEDVHQMRVATRRLRASLQVVAPVFEEKRVRQFRRKLRATADVLGNVRDADVFLEHLRAYRETLKSPRKASLDDLIAAVEAERAVARTALLVELDTKRYRRFKHEVARFLTTYGEGVVAQAEHGGPLRLRDLAGSLVWRRYEDLRSFEVIFPGAPDEQLHEMRIAGKRLRYTLEFFADALGDEVDACLKPLADLQEALGSLQDSVVARERIERLGMSNTPGARAYLARREAERTRMLRQLPTRWSRVERLVYRRKLFELVSAL